MLYKKQIIVNKLLTLYTENEYLYSSHDKIYESSYSIEVSEDYIYRIEEENSIDINSYYKLSEYNQLYLSKRSIMINDNIIIDKVIYGINEQHILFKKFIVQYIKKKYNISLHDREYLYDDICEKLNDDIIYDIINYSHKHYNTIHISNCSICDKIKSVNKYDNIKYINKRRNTLWQSKSC